MRPSSQDTHKRIHRKRADNNDPNVKVVHVDLFNLAPVQSKESSIESLARRLREGQKNMKVTRELIARKFQKQGAIPVAENYKSRSDRHSQRSINNTNRSSRIGTVDNELQDAVHELNQEVIESITQGSSFIELMTSQTVTSPTTEKDSFGSDWTRKSFKTLHQQSRARLFEENQKRLTQLEEQFRSAVKSSTSDSREKKRNHPQRVTETFRLKSPFSSHLEGSRESSSDVSLKHNDSRLIEEEELMYEDHGEQTKPIISNDQDDDYRTTKLEEPRPPSPSSFVNQKQNDERRDEFWDDIMLLAKHLDKEKDEESVSMRAQLKRYAEANEQVRKREQTLQIIAKGLEMQCTLYSEKLEQIKEFCQRRNWDGRSKNTVEHEIWRLCSGTRR